ncbi:MAG: glycoside hydrolase family 18 protein [Chlorobiaceae bacterium]|nr:glycoside hydrolase family 18 protein [Chlorobiaceae bacterium]
MRRRQRPFLLLLGIAAIAGSVWYAWSSGRPVTDGRYDFRANGIWIQHGWLGDDSWFDRNKREMTLFRDDARVRELADLFAGHGIRDVFPHLCPCTSDGRIALADAIQTERFLDGFSGFRVLPWIGGVLGEHCFPESSAWRGTFVSSVVALLVSHPRLAGIHLNIEPLPDGSEAFLVLLDELRQAMPTGKIISVAAFPPPLISRSYSKAYWAKPYYGQVAQRSDQIVPMMYDTAEPTAGSYRHLMRVWSVQALDWSGRTPVLFGVPAYDDSCEKDHLAQTENLRNAIAGIHAGLKTYPVLPENYSGVAIYCEWEMDRSEWDWFRTDFGKKQGEPFVTEITDNN